VFAAWELQPHIDWAALSPEIVVTAGALLLVLLDSVMLEKARPYMSLIAGGTLLGAMIPVIFLANDGPDRVLFDGAYVVDNFALVLKALFLLSGYVVVLLSTNYMAEGDYWESEFYSLTVASLVGMLVMASARDLVTMFVALELLSIPAYLLATWRKRDLRSNEAGLKYYLMGVFASAVMLYGMSLLYGVTGSTVLADIGATIGAAEEPDAVVILGVIFVVVGFAFKVSAFPFHTWSPDTYEGAPTPVTAFLAVASKTAGFVALLQLVFVAFAGRSDIYEPLFWVLAAGSMTAGNLIALRQTNIVRLMAYSGVAQAGYMLAPLVVAGQGVESADRALESIVSYLLIYAAMNLGVFAVILAVARKTRSAEIDSYRGLFQYAPGLTVAMTIFLFSLAGIPPLGGWFAKFQIVRALLSAESTSGVVMGIVVGLNSVIALYYYASIARRMWADPVPDGDTTPIRVPASLMGALAITVAVTLLFGILPQAVGHFTEGGSLLAVGG
jgi:NADH-quinone oxidoreductase subunit N